MERGEALPRVELAPQQKRLLEDEQLRETTAFVVGLGKYEGLPKEVFVDLLGYMMPSWADKGPAGGEQQPPQPYIMSPIARFQRQLSPPRIERFAGASLSFFARLELEDKTCG